MQPIHTQKSQKRLQPSQTATVYGAVQQKSVFENLGLKMSSECWLNAEQHKHTPSLTTSQGHTDRCNNYQHTLSPSISYALADTTHSGCFRLVFGDVTPFHGWATHCTWDSHRFTVFQQNRKKNNLVSWTWSIKLGMPYLHVAKTYSSISKTHFTFPVLSHSGS